MSKRTTKATREAAEKAAIRKRLEDIAFGAYGGFNELDFEGEYFPGMASELGLDAFGRWIGGIENAMLKRAEKKSITEARYLEHFDSLDSAANHLYKHGVRA